MGGRISRAVVALSLAGLTVPGSAVASSRAPAGADLIRDLAARTAAPVRLEGHAGDLRLEAAGEAFRDALAGLRAGPKGIDLRALGDLARAGLLTFGGVRAADPAALLDEQDGAAHIGIAGGDLDGDGLEDVLEIVIGIEQDGLDVVARDGATGAGMWSLPITGSDVILLPAGDVTGDGAGDVVVIELFSDAAQAAGECPPLAPCFVAGGEAFHWDLVVRSGPTGEAAWSRRTDGVVGAAGVDGFADQGFAFARGVAAINAGVLVFPSDDHDGDGALDLVVDEFDLVDVLAIAGAFQDQTSAFASGGAFVTATRAHVLGGADGAPIFSRVSASPGGAILAPGVDGVGDGTLDLLWDEERYLDPVGGCAFTADVPDGACAGEAIVARAIELLDGSSFATGWTADLGASGWLFAAGDADGDGADDINFLPFGEEQLGTHLISGSDGQERWSAPDVMVGVVGDVDGVPVVLSAALVPSEEGVTYEMRRRDGRDGTLLSARTHHVEVPPDPFLFIIGEFWSVPDVDGDGLDDGFSQVTIFGRGVDVYAVVERGHDGSDVFARDVDEGRFAVPWGDMDGDGLFDFLDIAETLHRRSVDLRFSGLAMPEGTALWDAPRRVLPGAAVFIDHPGDLTGAGGIDAVLSYVQFDDDGAVESAIEAVEASTGGVAWTVGGPLSDPPPVPAGGIAGRVTGDGEPFMGACVVLTDGELNEVAFALAEDDGTYVMPELDDGSYLVRFGDCFFGSRVEEWYDDALDPSEATPVVVAGAVTAGIDADLAALG